MIANKERYTFNFDGGSLLYFNMPQLAGAIYANPKLVNSYFNKNAVPSTKNESVLLSSNAKKHIIENSINMAGILEANHIILKNNQIILDTKLNDVNNESEVVYQLNEAINSLNEHASVH